MGRLVTWKERRSDSPSLDTSGVAVGISKGAWCGERTRTATPVRLPGFDPERRRIAASPATSRTAAKEGLEKLEEVERIATATAKSEPFCGPSMTLAQVRESPRMSKCSTSMSAYCGARMGGAFTESPTTESLSWPEEPCSPTSSSRS
jgi:hypothetical protein